MKYLIILVSLLFCLNVTAQTDAEIINQIYNTSLTNGKSYQWLDYLSNQIGGRLSGSLNAERAVEYTKAELDSLGLDKVWLQPVMVPRWVRGAPEYAYIETAPGKPQRSIFVLWEVRLQLPEEESRPTLLKLKILKT